MRRRAREEEKWQADARGGLRSFKSCGKCAQAPRQRMNEGGKARKSATKKSVRVDGRPTASGKGGPALCEAAAIEGRLLKREVEVAVRKGETGGGDR